MFDNVTRFSFPTAISFGLGASQFLHDYLKEAGISKPLVVTDPGLMKTDVYPTIEGILKSSGTIFAVFEEVHLNPLDEDIDNALQIYLKENCDGVIGLGGGSALDAAKGVGVLAVNGGKINDYDCEIGGNQKIKGQLPPMIAIPTTAGTGSEVGRCSIITSMEMGRKFLVCHPQMMPTIAVLDPKLTVSLPPSLTAATGMDALTHCIESLTAPVFHPMCDAIALKGIEYVSLNLEKAVKEPTDIEARGYMQIAAMMGAVAFQKDLGAVHSLAHALSAVCGVQHGLANAICLIPVMKFNKEMAAAEYRKVAACFGINIFDMSDLEAADKGIEAVAELNQRIGIPPYLSDVGVTEDDLSELTQKAFLDPLHKSNARPCTEEDLFNLFNEALHQ